MKKTFRITISIILALISCFMLCGSAFAGAEKTSSDPVHLVDAKIVWVPLKNRIVFGWGKPEKPTKMLIKLEYSDGNHSVERIIENDNRLSVGNECVDTTFRPDNVNYGINTDSIIIGGEFMVEYKYLVIPPFVNSFMGFIL